MKCSDLIGRRIVEIVQTVNTPTNGGRVTAFDRMVLDNGVVIYAQAWEAEDTGPVVALARHEPGDPS